MTATTYTSKAAMKPPYSKCGRLQLCSRCMKYCSRTKNMCPTCDARDGEQQKIIASLRPYFPTLIENRNFKHLVGTVGKQGVFVVWGDKQILNRETYREIASEAKSAGVSGEYIIYGRYATYTGPGMSFFNVSNG